MKRLIWTPALLVVFSVVAGPWGAALFASLAVPLLALGGLLFAASALRGSGAHGAATRAREVREQREPTVSPRMERQSAPSRAALVTAPLGPSDPTTTRRTA
jgi:hypothetical protein